MAAVSQSRARCQRRFGRRQRPGIAFEEGDVRAVGADGDLDGQQAAADSAVSACRTSDDLP